MSTGREIDLHARTLPVPGLLWGIYPERHDSLGQDKSHLPNWLRLLFDRIGAIESRCNARFVALVRAREAALRTLPDGKCAAAVLALKLVLQRDGFQDAHVAEAFALFCLECSRMLGLQLYDTQLVAGRIVLDNRLAEMATGEGKTLAVALAAASSAMAGIPTHVITANDYLVMRDADLMRPVYAAFGLSVGTVTQGQDPDSRRNAYACDITYCTAKELAFDYLRDSVGRNRDPLHRRVEALAGHAHNSLLRGLCMAIVDEADSILIDEARVPLILSEATHNQQEQDYFSQALALAGLMNEAEDFQLDQVAFSARLTGKGRESLEQAAAGLEPLWHNRLHREDTICTALAALHLYRNGHHYLIRDGKALIIDENTGRIAQGRMWSRGLHQLIELKEGCKPSAALATAAQITFQQFFPRYLRLGGLSGTLHESRGELFEAYGLAVRRAPLRRPCQRKTIVTRLFADHQALWDALASRIAELSQAGQPVLIGTESVSDSETLSRHLTEAGLPHAVLNARNDKHEADIVARAGMAGAVTVTTNMAGRGTDIPLGEGVAALGGLHIICCQLNAARRIDRQLAGRCARQGDPGSVEICLSLQTRLLQQNLPRWLIGLLRHRAPVLPGWLARMLFAYVQMLEEGRHFRYRKVLREQAEKMSRQLSFGAHRE